MGLERDEDGMWLTLGPPGPRPLAAIRPSWWTEACTFCGPLDEHHDEIDCPDCDLYLMNRSEGRR